MQSMLMPAGSPVPTAVMFGQHAQPLSPLVMGDSPALGTGYRAPQNTPAAAISGTAGSHVSMLLTPSQQADSAAGESPFKLKEEGALVISLPAEAPGVQDLLAAFRRAAGQERPKAASPGPAQALQAASPQRGSDADAPQAEAMIAGRATSVEDGVQSTATPADGSQAEAEGSQYTQQEAPESTRVDAIAKANESAGTEHGKAEPASAGEPMPAAQSTPAQEPLAEDGDSRSEQTSVVLEAVADAKGIAAAGQATHAALAAEAHPVQPHASGALPQDESAASVTPTEDTVAPKVEPAVGEGKIAQDATRTASEHTRSPSKASR